MDAAELMYAGATQQAEMVAAGEVSSRELVEASLSRIEALDPQLNAFVEVYAKEALAAADNIDRSRATGSAAGRLRGVPIAVKDEHDIAGHPTGWGLAGNKRLATSDGPVPRRLREAGAVIVGKTRLPELAICGFTESEHAGVTRNPWSLDHTCGGSSGGSAAAVAAGMVGLATASDGAGSIRIPAGCCGLFGFKPSSDMTVGSGGWGRLSVQGSLTRSTTDAARYFGVVAEHGIRPIAPALSSDPGQLRIGVSTTPMSVGLPTKVDDELLSAVTETADLLRSLGHSVMTVKLHLYGASNELSLRYLRGPRDSADLVEDPLTLDRRTAQILRLGRLVPKRALRWAQRRGEEDAGRLSGAFDEVDILLTPVFNRLPVAVGHWANAGGLRTVLHRELERYCSESRILTA